MKKFAVPEVEVVRFAKKDVITTSFDCPCVECPEGCPEGKDQCNCVDFSWANQ